MANDCILVVNFEEALNERQQQMSYGVLFVSGPPSYSLPLVVSGYSSTVRASALYTGKR